MCSVGHFRVSEIVMAIKMPTVLWEKNFCIRQYLGCVFCSLMYCYVMQLSANGSLTTILSFFYGYYSISLNFYLFLFKNIPQSFNLFFSR